MRRWAHRTNTGRVVYSRKSRPFQIGDVRRILRAMEPVDYDLEVDPWTAILDAAAMLRAASKWFQESDPGLRQALFGGGVFGGGGASRAFEELDKLLDVEYTFLVDLDVIASFDRKHMKQRASRARARAGNFPDTIPIPPTGTTYVIETEEDRRRARVLSFLRQVFNRIRPLFEE